MKRSKLAPISILVILGLFGWAWLIGSGPTSRNSPVSPIKPLIIPTDSRVLSAKRILFVNSYHQGYPWSDGILTGLVETLELKPQQEPALWKNADFVLRVFYMDTKRNDSEQRKITAAGEAENLIAYWKPDVVITSDDNAVKYLVVPMLKYSKLPFVFLGVNWDASEYRLPRNQVTGMLEVQPVNQIVATLLPFARGKRIGFLKGKDFSAVKEADAFENFMGITLQRRLVVDFEEWFTAYREMQQSCDILLLGNSASIHDWDEARAKQLIATVTQIPTGTWDAWMREYAMVTFSTVPTEQGVWGAGTARAILAGRSPAEIAVTQNRKAKIYRNMAIAKHLGIIFPMEFIRRSWAVERNYPE